MVIVLMGVTGCGKTTVGRRLAEELRWDFFDADDFHPPENKQKMSSGQPLTDEDRVPWLQALGAKINSCVLDDAPMILACSALKRQYRKVLRGKHNNLVRFVYLKGALDLIESRLKARKGHFMNPTLLPSQFQTLEEPLGAIYVDITPSPENIALEIRRQLGL